MIKESFLNIKKDFVSFYSNKYYFNFPSYFINKNRFYLVTLRYCGSGVERCLGKAEVAGSIPASSYFLKK